MADMVYFDHVLLLLLSRECSELTPSQGPISICPVSVGGGLFYVCVFVFGVFYSCQLDEPLISPCARILNLIKFHVPASSIAFSIYHKSALKTGGLL